MLIERVCTKMAEDEVRPNFPLWSVKEFPECFPTCDKLKSDIDCCCPDIQCRHAVSNPAGEVCYCIEADFSATSVFTSRSDQNAHSWNSFLDESAKIQTPVSQWIKHLSKDWTPVRSIAVLPPCFKQYLLDQSSSYSVHKMRKILQRENVGLRRC